MQMICANIFQNQKFPNAFFLDRSHAITSTYAGQYYLYMVVEKNNLVSVALADTWLHWESWQSTDYSG